MAKVRAKAKVWGQAVITKVQGSGSDYKGSGVRQ